MKLKLHEVITLNYELNGMVQKAEDGSNNVVLQGLLKQKMNMAVRAYVLRLNKVVAEEIKMYDELRQELFKKYGEESDGQITISPENITDFNKEHSELLLVDKDINTTTLWGDGLTIKDLKDINTDEGYDTFIKLVDEK
jgi:hypothetical protein